MAELQYLDIILSGYFSDERLLKKYLIRKQKELKRKNFVSKKEFIQRCQNIIIQFETDIENQYTKRRNELYQTVNLLKSENKPFEKELELTKNLSKDNLYIQLSSLSSDKWIFQFQRQKHKVHEQLREDVNMTYRDS